MARIFITGSSDGLGQMSAKWLIEGGNQVVLHARNSERGRNAIEKVPGAERVLIADLSNMEETKELAVQANELGPFDAVIHNAGVYQTSARELFAVNTLAPYVLTSLIKKPDRLIYLSSGMHLSGRPNIDYFRHHIDRISYADSKLHVMMLTLAVARKWPSVYCNAVDPGWVPTKMGGKNAPDDMQKGYETQCWLAASSDEKVKMSGRYFFHKKERAYHPAANNITFQEKLISALEDMTGVLFPT